MLLFGAFSDPSPVKWNNAARATRHRSVKRPAEVFGVFTARGTGPTLWLSRPVRMLDAQRVGIPWVSLLV